MIVRGNERVILKCSQLKTRFSYMYWYKQERRKDARLQLVIYSREGGGDRFPIETEFQDFFESPGMRDFSLNLILKEAKPRDTGTYFCAKQDLTVKRLHRKPVTNPFTGECT
ncbi:T-cell receptor beta chain V domain [Podarcis lilfordi]|nr:T-cell receptor beta chain V domain [Podarcis lilfordi]